MSLTNDKPKPRYRCTQSELYAICTIGWNSYADNVADFTALKGFYDAAFGTARLAAVAAAMAIPSYQQRNALSETDRIELTELKEGCLVKWQDLKRYIISAFPEAQHKPRLEDAGSLLYESASSNNWDLVEQLMLMGSTFITNNTAELSANNNMPAGFAAAFNTAKQDFKDKYEEFMTDRQLSEEITAEKIDANNAILDELMDMFADGVHIYRKNAAKRERFIFEQVKALVSGGEGSGGNELTFSGKVTDNITGAAIEAAELIVDGEVIATTNAAGEFTKTFTITEVLSIQLIIRKTGYNDYDEPVQFSPGVDLIQNVQMTPKVGSLSGTVSDAGTAMGIGGASVTITGNGVNMVLIADANGNYSAPDIRVGTYTVTANAPGHLGQSVSVTITENANTVQNFSLVVVP